MKHTNTARLRDPAAAAAFYEGRYESGYMDSWPDDKIAKVREVIAAAGLPERGVALDFGCGTGVFTELLVHALPGWQVYGTDVSREAVRKAQARVPGARFFVAGDVAANHLQIDFVFTHHVLEHVADLVTARDQLVRQLRPTASMLHILPCGNSGSLAHRLASMRTDGIDPELGNRFFFEDEGHVRRLTTDELARVFEPAGFKVKQAYYTGQRWGTLDYFTRVEPQLADEITDASHARTAADRRRLRLARFVFRAVLRSRDLVARFDAARWSSRKTLRQRLLLIGAIPAYLSARFVARGVERKAADEWIRRKFDPRGDQMFLLLERGSGSARQVPP